MGEVCLEHAVEAVLFVADGPVSIDALSGALQCEREQAEEAVKALVQSTAERGVRVVRSGDNVQMVTSPQVTEVIERFLGTDLSSKLSPAALETLAIIAYRQPVTRTDVEAVRGVNSSGVIRTLIAKELIEVQGRLEQVGRPEVLGTTFQFMQYFGISTLDELPDIEALSKPGTDVDSARLSDQA